MMFLEKKSICFVLFSRNRNAQTIGQMATSLVPHLKIQKGYQLTGLVHVLYMIL